MPSSASPQAPLALGRYHLVRRLGSGAFGVVWLARDEKLDRMVAVKRIELRDEQVAARAEREALAAARLSHPGIVALHETGRDEEAIHLVSELVRGPALADLLDAGALSDRDVLRIGVALTQALEHAHERGVIHRDVKPANVIVPERPCGESGLAKLTDFGVAAMVGDDGLTRTGDVVGTLAYMAPEQADGRPVTGAADLYALALVLYEALTGFNPVRAQGAAATARRVGTRLPALARARPELPAELCDAIDRALLPAAEHRGSLAELRDALALSRDGAASEVGHVGAAPAADGGAGPGDVRRWRGHAVEPWPTATADPAPPAGAPDRVLASVGAAALAGAALFQLPQSAGMTAGAGLLIAAGAGVGVGLLPRLGWAAALGLLAAGLALIDLSGVALLVVLAAAPVPLLLAGRPALWSAPAGGVLAGIASLALAWPAVAGQAGSPLRRAALGALGLWWLLLAEQLAGRGLLLGPLPGLDRSWTSSIPAAAGDVAGPLLASGAPLLALPWAAAALTLPMLVRGRSLALDLVAVTFWASALAAGSAAVADGLAWPGGAPEPHGIIAGSVLGAAVALVAAGARHPRGAFDLP